MSFRERWVVSIAIFALVALVACAPAAAPDEDETPNSATEAPSGGAGGVPADGDPLSPPGGDATGGSTNNTGGSGTNPPPADRIVVLAPIDGVEISIAESYPPQYFVRVLSGLPNGCARFDDYGVVREGDLIKIKVTNSVPAPGGLMACTMIYGTAEHNVALGTDFTPGETYTVEVNDVTETFVA